MDWGWKSENMGWMFQLQQQQLEKIEKQKMQRPPKPQIKSTKAIPSIHLRTLLTPDCQPQPDPQAPFQPIKSMRDTLISTSTGLHRSLNQVQNIQYLEISVAKGAGLVCSVGGMGVGMGGVGAGVRGTGSNFSGRGFKIRNFGNYRNKPVKENTLPIKIRSKPLSTLANGSQPKLQNGTIQILKLHPYPHTFHLHELCSKIGFHKLAHRPEPSQPQQFSNWAIILSQSLFYGSLLSQTNLLKLKYLCETFKKSHRGLSLILRLHSQSELPSIIHILQQKQIPLAYVIWGKHKYFQSINIYDVTELGKHGLDCFLVMEDQNQVIRNLYFQGKGDGHGEVDYGRKYLYLKFDGLAMCSAFSHKFCIYPADGEICVEKFGYRDDTLLLFALEELKQKIRISRLARKSHPEIRPPSRGAKPDRHQQLKQRLIQYSKIFQDQPNPKQKSKQKQKQKRRQSSVQAHNRASHKSSKCSNKRTQTTIISASQSKSCHQIVQELLRNNLGIMRQICRFREKVGECRLGLDSQEDGEGETGI